MIREGNGADLATPSTTPAGSSFRLGIVLDALLAPNWIYYVVEKLASAGQVKLLLIKKNSFSRNIGTQSRAPLLFRIWSAFDVLIHQSKSSALHLRDCNSVAAKAGMPAAMSTEVLGESHPRAETNAIREADLDLILFLTSSSPDTSLCECARLGLWWCGEETRSGVPDLFLDIYEHSRVTRYGPGIVEVGPSNSARLYRSHVITNRLSLACTQDDAYWDAASTLLTRLMRLASAGLCTENETIDLQSNAARAWLDNLDMLKFLFRWGADIVRHEFRTLLFREEWSILLETYKGSEDWEPGPARRLRSPRGSFYADPFLYEKEEHSYLFFEGYEDERKKGVILCSEIGEEGRCSIPRVALERSYHLSYPFVFSWKGEAYMIPESSGNGTIELYRATDFPYSWMLDTILMSGVAAVDSTLLQYQDKWWLFTAGVLEHAPPEKTLCLFHSTSPLGPWIAHPKNPIVSDPRSARPAGALFVRDGLLIRPGQDSSNGYGSATHLHRVDVLSELDYRETLVQSIRPAGAFGSIGVHTINQGSHFHVMDCKFLVPRFLPDARPSFFPWGAIRLDDARL